MATGVTAITAHDDIEKQVIPCGVSQAAPLFPIANGSIIMPFQVNPNGSLFVNQQGTIPADAITPSAQPIDATSYTMVWNGASWDRALSLANNTDNNLQTVIKLLGTVSRLQGWDPLNQFWQRLAIVSDNANTQAVSPFGLLGTVSRLQGWNGSAGQWARLEARPDNTDALLSTGTSVLKIIAEKYSYNGASWDRERTPNVFKTVTVTAAGSTAVWTPAAGKKFRLMGYSISVTGNAVQAVAGNFEAVFLDAAADIGQGDSEYVPAAALNAFGSSKTGAVNLGNGHLSAAANNILNISLSAALTAGEVRINVWGTEE